MGAEPSSTQKNGFLSHVFVLGCTLHSCMVAWAPLISGSEPSSATIICFATCSILETHALHRVVQQFVVAGCMLHVA